MLNQKKFSLSSKKVNVRNEIVTAFFICYRAYILSVFLLCRVTHTKKKNVQTMGKNSNKNRWNFYIQLSTHIYFHWQTKPYNSCSLRSEWKSKRDEKRITMFCFYVLESEMFNVCSFEFGTLDEEKLLKR